MLLQYTDGRRVQEKHVHAIRSQLAQAFLDALLKHRNRELIRAELACRAAASGLAVR